MITEHFKLPQVERWLTFFIFLHVFFWTVAPAIIRFDLPMDALEGSIWGHQLEWGYDKNPFLNGWLTRLALEIGGYSGWMTYFFSQLSVGISFWAIWQLGKKLVTPFAALIAVLLMESIQYYNLHAIDFNDNTLELSGWALTILYFYHAITMGKLRHWLLTGLFAALSMLTKYYSIMLLLPMLFFLCQNPTARQQLKNNYFYAGLLFFLLLMTPHLIWLTQHHFITIHYAIDRVASVSAWHHRILFPLQFAWQQIEAIIPTLLLFSMLLIGKKPVFAVKKISLSTFNRQFLFVIGLGPFLLTLIFSALFDWKLRAAWGQPLFSLTGLLLMVWLTPNITREKFYSFLALWVALFTAMVSVYSYSLIRAKQPSSANFPGKIIANVLTQEWQQTYQRPLNYVAGPRWMAGNVALFSPDHPAVFMDWDTKKSPWIDEATLKKQGAIFIWDPTEAVQVSSESLRSRFHHLGAIKVAHFSWLRNPHEKPIEMSYAFLPPEETSSSR